MQINAAMGLPLVSTNAPWTRLAMALCALKLQLVVFAWRVVRGSYHLLLSRCGDLIVFGLCI